MKESRHFFFEEKKRVLEKFIGGSDDSVKCRLGREERNIKKRCL